MSLFLAANWKMHKNPAEAAAYFKDLFALDIPKSTQLSFFVPSVNAAIVARSLKDSSVIWGPQNIYPAAEGAFTGETSPQVMASLGAKIALVGHSERRQLFHESNEQTNLKVKSCLHFGMTPLLCVGENLEQRKLSQTLEVIKTQLIQGLKDCQQNLFHIAYEPIWAIGTGEVANSDQVSEVHSFIRTFLNQNFQLAQSIKILYGGSVKSDNASDLFSVPDVQGFLVGGASLKANSFCEIAQVCES